MNKLTKTEQEFWNIIYPEYHEDETPFYVKNTYKDYIPDFLKRPITNKFERNLYVLDGLLIHEVFDDHFLDNYNLKHEIRLYFKGINYHVFTTKSVEYILGHGLPKNEEVPNNVLYEYYYNSNGHIIKFLNEHKSKIKKIEEEDLYNYIYSNDIQKYRSKNNQVTYSPYFEDAYKKGYDEIIKNKTPYIHMYNSILNDTDRTWYVEERISDGIFYCDLKQVTYYTREFDGTVDRAVLVNNNVKKIILKNNFNYDLNISFNIPKNIKIEEYNSNYEEKFFEYYGDNDFLKNKHYLVQEYYGFYDIPFVEKRLKSLRALWKPRIEQERDALEKIEEPSNVRLYD